MLFSRQHRRNLFCVILCRFATNFLKSGGAFLRIKVNGTKALKRFVPIGSALTMLFDVLFYYVKILEIRAIKLIIHLCHLRLK